MKFSGSTAFDYEPVSHIFGDPYVCFTDQIWYRYSKKDCFTKFSMYTYRHICVDMTLGLKR